MSRRAEKAAEDARAAAADAAAKAADAAREAAIAGASPGASRVREVWVEVMPTYPFLLTCPLCFSYGLCLCSFSFGLRRCFLIQISTGCTSSSAITRCTLELFFFYRTGRAGAPLQTTLELFDNMIRLKFCPVSQLSWQRHSLLCIRLRILPLGRSPKAQPASNLGAAARTLNLAI